MTPRYHARHRAAVVVDGVLNPWALDPAGNLVDCNDAERGDGYTCPSCGERLWLKRGDIIAPHFAHARASRTACAPAAVERAAAHKLIGERLQRARDGEPLSFPQDCPCCGLATDQFLEGDRFDAWRGFSLGVTATLQGREVLVLYALGRTDQTSHLPWVRSTVELLAKAPACVFPVVASSLPGLRNYPCVQCAPALGDGIV